MTGERDRLSPEVLLGKYKGIFSQIKTAYHQALGQVTVSDGDVPSTINILESSGNLFDPYPDVTVARREVADFSHWNLKDVLRDYMKDSKARDVMRNSPDYVNGVLELRRLLEDSPATESFKRFVVFQYSQEYKQVHQIRSAQDMDPFNPETLAAVEKEAFWYMRAIATVVSRGGSGIGARIESSQRELDQLGIPNEAVSFYHELVLTWSQEYMEKYKKKIV